jgi:oxidase EvaA
MPIAALSNWVIEKDRIRERVREQGFMARHFRVTALGREVKNWDQPLIDSDGIGRIVLVCQERKGLLHFLVKARCEIGFLEGVQLSASVMIEPGLDTHLCDSVEDELLKRAKDGDGASVIASCRQSEEGGRFFQDENDYSIVMLDPSVSLTESHLHRWATLGELKQMINVPGALSMELRGIMAMLLRWL